MCDYIIMSNIITHNKHSKQVKGEKILPYPKTKKDQKVLVMEGRLMPDVIDKMTIAHNTSLKDYELKVKVVATPEHLTADAQKETKATPLGVQVVNALENGPLSHAHFRPQKQMHGCESSIYENIVARKIPMKNSPWTQGLVPKYVRTVLALSLLMSSSVLAFPGAVEPTFNSTTTANPGKQALSSSKLFDSEHANSTTLSNEQVSADLAMLIESVCRFIRAVAFCVHFL